MIPVIDEKMKQKISCVEKIILSEINVNDWIKIFDKFDIKIEDGPAIKTGANGPIKSIYVRDPDKNLIEISNQI